MHINHQSPLSGAGLTVALNPTLRSRSPFLIMSNSNTLNRLCQEENASIRNFSSVLYICHAVIYTPIGEPHPVHAERKSLIL